ncbi:glycosyltransferase [Tepidibacter sp. Z1-5]|uniref:glycosyltransferase n=1 Tax=Tepidibacter sp. Z1-5 TaxID=3134138 RepID=UPI0030C18D51
MNDINSKDWWNNYFMNEWEKNGGKEQSSFFMKTIIDNIPHLVKEKIKSNYSILDLGCALGQGTKILKENFKNNHVIGMDFSKVAIEKAKDLNPELDFYCNNIENLEKSFDIIISSNCLEHFENPLEELNKQLKYAKKLYILMVPYNEDPLSTYHKSKFLENSFPEYICKSKLIFKKIINMKNSSYWPGEQIIAIYEKEELNIENNLNFSRVETWDEIANSYNNQITEEEIEITKEITKIFHKYNINENDKLLELGCGSGHISGLLNKQGFNTTLIDFSKVALEKSKKFFEFYNLKGQFIQENMFKLDKVKPMYDVIWNSGVMEHFNDEDLLEAFIAIRKKVKKYFIFIVPNPESLSYLFFRYNLMSKGKWSYGKEYLRRDYEKFLNDSGFELIGERYIASKMTEYLFSVSNSDMDIKEYFHQFVENNLLPEKEKYLKIYIAAPSENINNKNTKESNDKENTENITEIFDLRAIIFGLENNINILKNTKNNYETKLIEKDEYIKPLLDNLKEQTKEIEGQNQKIKEQTKEIQGQNEKIEEQTKEIQGQNEKIEEQTKEIQEQNEKIEEQTKEIEKQENNILILNDRERLYSKELNQIKFELKQIHKSDFWKLALKYYRFRDNVWPFNKIYKHIQKKNLEKLQKNRIDNNINNLNNQTNKNNNITSEIKFKKHEKYQKNDILFMSIIDWNFRHQRPQHLASYMAEQGHRVFYFNANFTERSLKIEKLTEKLKVLTLPNEFGQRIYDIDFSNQIGKIEKQLDQIILEHGIKDCVIFVEYPTWVPAIRFLKEKYKFKVIFDYLDDFTGFNTTNPTLIDSNEKLFNMSDQIIATSQYLYDKAKQKNSKVTIVRNGTEYKHFNEALDSSEIKNNKRPIIGYYGAIAEWFDIAKVKYIAQHRPEWDIILIGDSTYADVEELKNLENVKLLGEKKYQELPNYLKDFDVCIIPFKTDIDLIKATNPVKFYEYLSAGKKVVSTEIPELEEFKDRLVYLTNDNEKFLQYTEKCLYDKDELLSLEDKLEFAKNQDWKERSKKIEQIVKKRHGLVSIILVTFNNLEFTKECIDSILNKTAYPNYELVIVDNKSSDDTPEYLKELQDKYPNITIILNEENYGFAKGNNIGIKHAKGDYIILLNNDTVVTKGWITGLVKHLDRDNNLGLVGPVTNSIGNESKINVSYSNIKDMDDFAEEYTNVHFNELYKDIGVLAMFCVAIKKEVLEDVGYLDESYGIGMFEDDDFSYRVKGKGYNIACAEDVFIHHYGSVSFKKMEDKKFRKIFETNKKIFEEKWNTTWTPHEYREGVE